MFTAESRDGPLAWGFQIPTVLFMLALSMLSSPVAGAEQLDARIEVFTELLPAEKQDKLENLEEELSDYFNDYTWIEDLGGPPIPFSFRMYLVDESTGFEDRYGARIHVSNDYDMQFLDKDSHFPYRPEDRLDHEAVIYHPLAGLLDFYAYLIIGTEMDKRATLGGDPYFKKAWEAVQRGLFSEYYRGWNRRGEEIEFILAEENMAFRKMLAVFFRALEYARDGEIDNAHRYCRSALTAIQGILKRKETDEGLSREQDEQIARFFTFHHLEIAELFQGDPRGHEVMNQLIAMDPENREVYEKYLRR